MKNKNRFWYFMQIVSWESWETICMKSQGLFSSEKKKKEIISKCRLLKFYSACFALK